MSRKLTVILPALLVLVGAMSLKTIATAHGNGQIDIANGPAPVPTPWNNGPAPVPTPWKNGPAPVPTPWK